MFLIALIFASIFGSLIPAFVAKLLMSAGFKRNPSYLAVLGAMALTTFFTGMLIFFMGYDSEAALDAMPNIVAIMISILALVIQVIALNVIAFDERGASIGMGKWAAVLVLQYVVYFALIFTFVMLWFV